MFRIIRSKNFYMIFFLDIFSIMLSFYLAYVIRFEFRLADAELNAMFTILPWVIIIKMSTFVFFGLYRGMWRYTSVADMINVLKATIASTMLIVFFILMVYHFHGYPRSIVIIDWGVTVLLIGGTRMGIRLFFEQYAGFRLFPFFLHVRAEFKKLLIIGAGNAGEKVVREILENPSLCYIPMGFLDDDPTKTGKTIHGIQVLGNIDLLNDSPVAFDEILIALPSVSGRHMRRIVALCEQTGKPFRTVPAMKELINGNVSMKFVRNVTIHDLLNREEVRLDDEQISTYLEGKRVLVTGAGGSIGSELVRQIRKFHPEALALVDVSEFNLFQIDRESRHNVNGLQIHTYLADIRIQPLIRNAFEQFRPHVVFHAAAYKHVPLQELHPWETVHNNVVGTQNLIKAAQEFEIEKFVLVSTDKAVRPTNVMGATKRIAEHLVANANQHSACQFMAVRFGNVIGSSGSVIPIFQEQIDRGGPVTITHPDIFRYFMSIPEAAQLILEAGAMGNGGEIFILDMGEPVRIADLAKDLIRLHGYEPEHDIPIQYVGLRPGEKLYEELITEGEGIVETNHEKIMVLRGDSEGDNQRLLSQIDELLEVAHIYNPILLKQKLHDIVPEYTPEVGYN